MAKEPKQANAPKIEFDALAETVVPDPATISDSVALAGFVGRSDRTGSLASSRRRLSKTTTKSHLPIFSTVSKSRATVSIRRIGRLRQEQRSLAAGAGFNGNRSPVSAGPNVERRRAGRRCGFSNWGE